MKALPILLLAAVGICIAQPPPGVILWYPGNPPGGPGAACTEPNAGYFNTATGAAYSCPTGTLVWTALGSGGGSGAYIIDAVASGAPSANCTAPTTSALHVYIDSSTDFTWYCAATNTWRLYLSSTGVGPFSMVGTGAPYSTDIHANMGTCTTARYFLDSDSPHGLYVCPGGGGSWSSAINAGTLVQACIFDSTTPAFRCFDSGGNPTIAPSGWTDNGTTITAAAGRNVTINSTTVSGSPATATALTVNAPTGATSNYAQWFPGSGASDSASLGAELTDGTGWTSAGWTGSYNAFVHTAGAIQTGPAYVSGASSCTNGTQAVTFTNGGGSGATGTITVSGNVPTGSVTITAEGSGYTSVPTTATVATCTGTATLSGGALDIRALSRSISGVASGKYYQLVLTISSRTAGSVSVSVGSTLVDDYGGVFTSGTYTRGPKATGTGALTITPTATFNGTVGVSLKLITPISTWTQGATDSTGAVSYQSLLQQAASLKNIFTGGGGSFNTTGYYNSAQGASALQNNTTGYYNSAQGFNALYSNTTGYNNSAQGAGALYSNTTGYYNSAQGLQALYYNTTGYNNSAQGANALYSNTTGNNNSAQGFQAGYTATPANANVSGSNNTWLGFNSGPGSPTQYNYQSVIGAAAVGTCSNCIVLGRAGGLDTVYAGDAGADPMIVLALATVPVLSTALKTCTATTGVPWRASVTDAVAPALGVALTGGGTTFANVHCSLTTGTYVVDGI